MKGESTAASAGAAAIVCATGLWGLWPIWVRGGAGGAQVATLALAVAAVLGAPLAIAEGRGRQRPVRAWLLIGLFGACAAAKTACYFRALAEGLVAPAILGQYLAPVMVTLAAPLALGEVRSPRTPVAVAVALAGTALLVLSGQEAGGMGGERAVHAFGLGAASAVFFASNVLLGRRLASHFGNAEIMAYHAVIAVAFLVPLTGFPADGHDFLRPMLGGAVSTLGAGLLYYAGLRRIPAERAAILSYVEPLAAITVGWIAFGERPSAAGAVGGTMILAGAWWSSLRAAETSPATGDAPDVPAPLAARRE
jgi:drug/metabolite transporter (DMT)-like permease